MEVFPKFIIEDGNLILSKVTRHHQLVTDRSRVKGGGWFRYLGEIRTFELYGGSEDFGKAELKDIQQCVEYGRVYSNKSCTHSITDMYYFQYNTGTEIIKLKPNNYDAATRL